jgi:phage terminase Nu1 subunit (DNA packaging protein)
MTPVDLDITCTQAEFGALVGVSQAKVSQLLADGILREGDATGQWLLAYCERLREQAAGRLSVTGGLDPVRENARLSAARAESQEIKNRLALGTYAPIAALTVVLADASKAVADRMDQLAGALQRSCPDLPEDARTVVETVLAGARNEWVRATAAQVLERLAVAPESSTADESLDPAAT